MHAMKFPAVKRVVYSTCSIYQEENENVVRLALSFNPSMKLINAIPSWKRRGLPVFDGAENCIRTVAKEDKTQGFFVACFEKTSAVLREWTLPSHDLDDIHTKHAGTKRTLDDIDPTNGSETKTQNKKRKKKRNQKKIPITAPHKV